MTPRQAEAASLRAEGLTVAQMAARMGISERRAQQLLRRAREQEERREDQDEGLTEVLDELRLPNAAMAWIKTDRASVLVRAPTAERDEGALLEALREGLSDLRAAPLPRPPATATGLLAVFPVADLHIGMLADPEETGVAWDTGIALRTFHETFARLVDVTPAADAALIAQLGDASHTDDQRNVTPGHGHQLDADSRYFLILRRTVAAMKGAIEALRTKYPRVIYRGQRGNHDPHASYAVTLALAEFYRDSPDVEIIESAAEFYVHEHGRNMVLLHHGDRAKAERVAHFAAANWPEVWGRTRHRFAFSGHLHHEVKREVGGMTCETFGTIIPRDAYAASHAYAAKRGLVSLTLDAVEGEVARARVGVN